LEGGQSCPQPPLRRPEPAAEEPCARGRTRAQGIYRRNDEVSVGEVERNLNSSWTPAAILPNLSAEGG